MIRRLFVVLAVSVCLGAPMSAKGTSKGSSHKGAASTHAKTTHSRSTSTAPRDANGRIKRSAAAKHQFEVQTGYPHGRPGYIVDRTSPSMLVLELKPLTNEVMHPQVGGRRSVDIAFSALAKLRHAIR